MDYQNRLYELLNKEKESDNNILLLNKYVELLNSLDECSKNINNLKDYLYYDVFFVKNKNFHKYYELLKKCSIFNDLSIKREEISKLIKYIYNFVNEEYQSLLYEANYYNEVSIAIENNSKNIIIEFLTNALNNNHLSSSEYLKLVRYVMTRKEEKNEPLNEIIIEENETSIDLNQLFESNGYNFDSIPERERKKITRLAKEDNIKTILSFLKDNNISDNNFQERIKIITDLIIFFDKRSLEQIKLFLMNNDVSLNTLLGVGAIFFERDITFKMRKRTNNGEIEEKMAPKVIPHGNLDSLIYNINLIKQDLGYSDSYRITDADLAKRNILLLLDKNIVSKNLDILRKYGIIDNIHLPKSLTSLNTKNTEYIIDRYIEAGLYDYLSKKQPSLVPDDKEEFRFFKIRRAIQLGDSLFAPHGIKQKYINDEPLYGISITDDNINQELLDDDLLKKALSNIDLNFDKEKKYYLFRNYFKLKIVNPTILFKADFNGESYPSYGSKVEEVFLNDYQNNSNYEFDEFIEKIDNLKIKFDNEYIPIKYNDYEYRFNFPGKNGYAGMNLIISRQKVLRLCTLLKQNNLWINDDMPNVVKENLILSVLLKDTVLTYHEIRCLRGYIRNFILYMGGKHK